MRIGILVLSIGSFGTAGFYNLQETGLAKALDSLGNETVVYKLVPASEERRKQPIEGTRYSMIHFLPSKQIGTNGVPNLKLLDRDLDLMICFSDTQYAVPAVFRWAQKNGIPMLPYIGVLESHSTKLWIKRLINLLFQRNLTVYRKCRCLVKTPTVGEQLARKGVADISVIPVGLDLSMLKTDSHQCNIQMLKQKYGYSGEDKVLLFVGRFIEEKQPERMIEIFFEVRKQAPSCKLLMVGTGELKTTVDAKIHELGLNDAVQKIERIPNSDIWELYRLADAFVNLNQQEIFGMAILEAMYYGCKVVAWEAPGPSYIIENGVSGWLVRSNAEAVEKILDAADLSEASERRILTSFTWQSSAEKILSISGEKT